MENLEKLLVAGKVVELTVRLAHKPDNFFIQKDGYAEKSYKTTIHTVEDKGDYFYVCHIPLNKRDGRYGCIKLYKDGSKKYGTVAVKEV